MTVRQSPQEHLANAGSQQAFGFPQTASAGLPATTAAASLSADVWRLPLTLALACSRLTCT